MGGGHDTYIRKMQTMVNHAARFVLKANNRTSTRKLMANCKWLLVTEYIEYFSMISMWNLNWRSIPFHLTLKIRHGPENTLVTPPARLQTTSTSHRWKATKLWNTMPTTIRSIPSLPRFKNAVRQWILSKRPSE